MDTDRTSISSLLSNESDGETFFADDVFEVSKKPEIKPVLSDALDYHAAEIAKYPPKHNLSEADAKMDLDDLEVLQQFLRGESDQVPYSYSGGVGYVWANAISPDRLDQNHRVKLQEDDTRFSPLKQISFGIFAHIPARDQEENLKRPKYTVVLRNEDVFHDLDSRRVKYSPTVGIEVQIFTDNSIKTIPTKYSGEMTYRADEEAMNFASNHPFAKRIELAVNQLKR